jgi:2-methylisocitrate lyase-like PEP mutase family enzyme
MNLDELHQQQRPLLLPNAWDVGSAIAFADAGFPAIGTTSFGVGAVLGHPDGARASREATVALVHALAGMPILVSADIEDGYSDDPDEVARFVKDLATDGVNVEDSTNDHLIDSSSHAAKVEQIKRVNPDTFVNARIDNYWLGQDAHIETVLAKAKQYVDAGADGIFIPGVSASDEIRVITAGVAVPVNVLAVTGMTLSQLADLGVRRVSTGSLPYRAAVDAGVAVATGLRDGGTPPAATAYPIAQARLQKYSS